MSIRGSTTVTSDNTADVFAVSRGETAAEPARAAQARRKGGNAARTGDDLDAGVRFEPSHVAHGAGELDRPLLARAADLLEGFEHMGDEERSLAIESLRFVVCELWPSAARASQYH